MTTSPETSHPDHVDTVEALTTGIMTVLPGNLIDRRATVRNMIVHPSWRALITRPIRKSVKTRFKSS
jgi:hypothetical protein